MRRPPAPVLVAAAIVAAGIVALAGIVLSNLGRQERFPHDAHEGLFPSCTGCHAGVMAGDTAAFVSITSEGCAACHDGVDLDRVVWTGYEGEASNLRFSHDVHAAELRERGEPAQDCVDCHTPRGAEIRMAVDRAVAESCLDCHAPEAPDHFDLATVDCSTCHLPLAAAADLTSERVASLPQPEGHARDDFLFVHGAEALAQPLDCAVCHARESCERCHVDAERLAPIVALARDTRVAAIVSGRAGEWPVPPSHLDPDWLERHGARAREEIDTCATCHARDSCAACHMGGQPAVIARLAAARPGGPAGVSLAAARPPGHTIDFVANHGVAAALRAPDCTVCHTERQCQDCHDGVGPPSFHTIDFVARHGAEAFANDSECAACHSREGFCRDCHNGVGLAVSRTSGGAFHDAVPDWLLAHGAAARQDLEACTTCHQERSCLRCHSAKAGLRVSPHGPDFDPTRVSDRSTQACAICHFDLPEGAP